MGWEEYGMGTNGKTHTIWGKTHTIWDAKSMGWEQYGMGTIWEKISIRVIKKGTTTNCGTTLWDHHKLWDHKLWTTTNYGTTNYDCGFMTVDIYHKL